MFFRAVALEMRAQMGSGFLLAHPTDPQEVVSPSLPVAKGCSYQAGVTLIRRFAILFLASPGEHRDQRSDRFADAHKITLHSLRSFRSWLATLCRQIEAPDRETNELLHWMNKTMVRCYAKNFSAVATVRRRRIVAVLNSDWRSAGPGQRLRAPPLWDTIAVDGNWNRTARF